MTARLPILVACVALGGCGLVPPAVSIASFAADALSYAVSGKSVSDHGLSMVMREDCAVFNIVDGEEVCEPGRYPEIEMVAPRDPDTRRTLLASAGGTEDAEGPHWAPPASAGVLPADYAMAGPVLAPPEAKLVPAAIVLEPLASGPLDILADAETAGPPV